MISRVVPIAGDGSFACAGLQALNYDAVLVKPCFGRLTRPLEFALGNVEVGKDRPIEWDAGACFPGRLEGRIQFTAAIPTERLLVLATPRSQGNRPFEGSVFDKILTAGVDPAGRFSLDLVLGSYDLVVADAASGIVLSEEKQEVALAAGEQTTTSLAVRTVRVRVKLEPTKPEQPIRAAALYVDRGQRRPTQFGVVETLGVLGLRAGGIPIDPWQTEVELWLPPGVAGLVVRNQAGYLSAGDSYSSIELAKESVSFPESGNLEVTLRVAAPPSIPEPEGRR